jgi:hypothetical protein
MIIGDYSQKFNKAKIYTIIFINHIDPSAPSLQLNLTEIFSTKASITRADPLCSLYYQNTRYQIPIAE